MVLSYLISAFAALLSALCYTEFVVDLPLAGGAFNYISLVFGELAAWCATPPPRRPPPTPTPRRPPPIACYLGLAALFRHMTGLPYQLPRSQLRCVALHVSKSVGHGEALSQSPGYQHKRLPCAARRRVVACNPQVLSPKPQALSRCAVVACNP